jgi:hypothetical protein
MSQSIDIKLHTGRLLSIHELTGQEQTAIDEMIGLDKGLSAMAYRAVACIDGFDGTALTPPTSIIDLKYRVSLFTKASELEHLSIIVRKRFGLPDSIDELGNV